jgi:hypothetical protein
MPATTSATPIVLQGTGSMTFQSSAPTFVLQSTPIIPAVPVYNTAHMYSRYGFVPQPVETTVTKADIETPQIMQTNTGLLSHVAY